MRRHHRGSYEVDEIWSVGAACSLLLRVFVSVGVGEGGEHGVLVMVTGWNVECEGKDEER